MTWSFAAVPAGGDQFNQLLAVDQSTEALDVSYSDAGTHGATATKYTLTRGEDGGRLTATVVATAPTDEPSRV